MTLRLLLYAPAALSLGIYALTWTSQPVGVGTFFPMHLVAMGMFGALLISQIKVGNRPTLRQLLPGWRAAVAVAVMVFALVNFVSSGIGRSSTEGQPQPTDPSSDLVRVVSNHGSTVRWLTPAQVAHEDRLELRGFSGHWILFTLIAGMGLEAKTGRKRRSEVA